MAKTKSTDSIVTAFRLVNNARLGKMETAERYALIKAIRQLKKVATEFDEMLKDAQDKLKTDGIEAIAAKMQLQKVLTIEENVEFNRYNKSISDCLKDELTKDIELTFEPLSETALDHLIESNDFSASEIILIEDMLGA